MKKLNSIIQKHILLFVGVVMLTHSLNAQSVSSCGTVFSADPNFNYQAYQQFVQQSSFFPMVGLPIRIHIIRQSNGSGGVSYNDVQNQLSNANNQYSNSNLSFFECSSVDYIDDSNLYTYELTTDETSLIAHNDPNVINVYYVNTGATGGMSWGGIGKFPFWGNLQDHYVAVTASNLNDNSTLAHELGHYLGLYHTHETSNGVEYVNGSNCGTAGDLLCDTPADPNLFSCSNSSCQYTCPTLTDPLGQFYSPLMDNIMSYAYKAPTWSCGTDFTNDQDSRAYFIYLNWRNYLVCGGTIPDDPCDATSIPVSTSCNFISGTNVGATNSSVASIACDGSAMDGDIWFKAVIPPSGDLIIDSDEGSIDDLGMAIYTGTCSSLSYYGCYPNGSTYSTYMPYASLTGLTPGSTIWIRLWEYNNNDFGTFSICAYDPSPTIDDIFITNEQVDVTSINAGGTINVDCNQNYNGTSGTTLYPYVGYFLSTDCNYDQGVDVFLGDDQSSLDVTDTDDPESESLVIPAGTTAGNYYVLFEADWTDVVSEGVNENNNTVCVALQVTGTGIDDIFISNEQVDVTSINAGGTINVDCNQNYNGTSSTTLYPYVGYFLSTDCNYDQGVDVFLGDDQSSLDVTDIDDPESESLVIPAGTTAGNYYVLFEADWTDVVSEGVNENNNTVCVALQVTGTGGNPVTQCISAGGQHSLAVCSDNSARDWGWNLFGQLGNSNNNDSYTPVQVTGLMDVIAISGGREHSVALKSNGTVWTWGHNNAGQLGDGSNSDSNIPVQVTGLSNVIAIAGGSEHTLALLSNNTVWAWGSNSNGQLGNGTTNDSPTPVQVLNLTGIVSIATGLDHSIALKADGTVWAWGFGSYGQIGNGTNNGTNTIAAQATGLNGVTAIEGGYGHSLAVRSNGTVWAWGYNNYGQLGNGNNIDSNIPVQVSNLSGVVKVAGGFIHSLALKSNGTVSAWGYNNYGQLGDNTTIDKNTPVQVVSLTGAVSIAAGDNHSLALKSDASLWGWGYNFPGPLGDGTIIDRHAPVQTINLCQVAIPTVVESIIDESNIFTVFPNPTSGLLNIKVKGLSNEKCKITLTSILGQILIEEEFMARNHSIETQFDMKDLSNGIYFLSVTSNKIKQTFKVQKQ